LVRIEDKELYTPLHGAFNASNLLAVYAVCALLGFDKEEVTVAMSQLKPVEGRFNVVMGSDKVLAIVDFAHTPDALKNVYEAIAQLRTKNERLITVLGCGGDRDQTKRPEMGKIAAEQSDVVIFTSDNPRNEDPLRIIDHMNEGVSIDLKRKVLVQPDRLEALKMAVTLAQPNDILLVAGKGHEKYQEIGGQRFDFDDLKIVKELLNA
jgi:UDP-N-acetylmuramoyl-L-alanyl-D-glutamate--2,6-diaminopimelate ligase